MSAFEDHGVEASFTSVFSRALRGEACAVVGLRDAPASLPVQVWSEVADLVDREMLSDCIGPTLDIGCGPGRLAEALAQLGHFVLGIDVVDEAVAQTKQRGVEAVRCDVFDRVPGQGRWQTALLADGNLGIGGDPIALLARLRGIIEPAGRVVVEVEPPGIESRAVRAHLRCGTTVSRPFRWAVVGIDDLASTAGAAAFEVIRTRQRGGRWWAILQPAW